MKQDLDLFAPVRLTSAELRCYNRTVAHPAGMHMCSACRRVYAWTEDNFFKSSKRRRDGTVILMPECRACRTEWSKAYSKQRYAASAEYREEKRSKSKAYWDTLSPAAKLAHSRKRKARKYERVLSGGKA